MDDMTEFLQSHQIIHLDSLRLADSVDIVPRQIDQHDMLCTIFLAGQQLFT
jgi:hypothetical protein